MTDGSRELARRYDELYRGTGFGDAPRFYRWILSFIDDRSGNTLDLGCGAGGALKALAEAGTTPWGLDLSGEALRHAREQCPSARLVRGDGTRLPFPDGAFQTVLNLGNLEHFEDLEGGIREMRRVLAPGGQALVLLPNLFYSGAIWKVIRSGVGPDHHQPIDRFATRQEWRDLLEAGGLRVERDVPYHKGKRWKRLLPSNLAWHFLYITTPGEPSGRRPLPPLGRRRPE